MQIYKRFSIIIIAVMILSLVFVGGASAKPGGKVEICHYQGNGSYELKKVNANTLQTHLAHGDVAPGAAVPGQPGMVLTSDCTVTTTAQNVQVQTNTVPPATKNGKKADKVDVCHRRGNGTFILININGNALPAHLHHGDGLPNGEIPTQPGKFLKPDCSVSEVPQKQLVQSLTVISNATSNGAFVPVVSDPLLNGQLYELKVSGTYTYNPNNDWADAEYFQQAGATVKGDTQYPSNPNILDLSINSCSTNTDWGSPQSSHVYTMPWTGTGAQLSFCIYDSNYADNNGFLTVEIWKINW